MHWYFSSDLRDGYGTALPFLKERCFVIYKSINIWLLLFFFSPLRCSNDKYGREACESVSECGLVLF